MKRTTDILQYVGEHRRAGQVIRGFSMETENLLENSSDKLRKKNVDMICASSLNTAGGADALPLLSKEDAASAILDRAIALSGRG